MHSYHTTTKRGGGHLWAAALILSVVLHVLLLAAIIGIGSLLQIASILLPTKQKPASQKPPAVTVQISPDMLRAIAKAVPPAASPPVVIPPARQESARTSEDQRGKRPDKPAYIGERDTEATSDRTPDAAAPPLPSQFGIEPRNEQDLETTESRYRDGKLPELSQQNPPITPPPSVPPSTPAQQEKQANATPPRPEEASPPPPRLSEKLLEGPNPVEVPVQEAPKNTQAKKDKPPGDSPREMPPRPQRDPTLPDLSPRPPIKDPAFSGYQRKTTIRGSISRTGRSALNVEDSPLGRYQALISRAVELEWQRNCVRHRDFITPGYLSVRFYVEASGKVRSVQFVDSMETSEVQKGFTLNSIRDAEIPPMPQALRKDFSQEPLELIFNFYF